MGKCGFAYKFFPPCILLGVNRQVSYLRGFSIQSKLHSFYSSYNIPPAAHNLGPIYSYILLRRVIGPVSWDGHRCGKLSLCMSCDTIVSWGFVVLVILSTPTGYAPKKKANLVHF